MKGAGTTTEPQSYSFADVTANPGQTYFYWLEVVDLGAATEFYGPEQYTPGDSDGDDQTDQYTFYELSPSYPNPAKNVVTIDYQLKGSVLEQDATINIYNILGKLVKQCKGNGGSVEVDVSNLTSGIYLYQLKTPSYNEIKKMIIVD